MLYRVPYRIHRGDAVCKASIHYELVPAGNIANRSNLVPAPGALFVEFTAKSHKEAREALQELILNGDERPVMGRSNVKWFVVNDSDDLPPQRGTT